MGLFTSCGQCVLVILNIIFVLVALILFTVGIILKFYPGVLFKFLFDGIKDVTYFDVPKDASDINNIPLLNTLGLAAFILGIFLFVVAFLACCGACCRWRPLLGGFCVCVVILIVAISVVGGLYLSTSSPIHKTFKRELSKEVYKDYKGPKSPDIFSLVVNILSYSLNCCGMNGTGDFNTSAPWTNYKLDDTRFIHIDVTPACCNHIALEERDITCAQKNAAGRFDPSRTNTEGCYDKILDLLQNNKIYAIIIIVVLILLLILEMIFAVALIGHETYSRM